MLRIYILLHDFTEENYMNLKINPTSSIPLIQQVETLLRDLIVVKEYQNGKLLPNELELAKVMGVSRTTLRQAINKLVFEELLIRKKGRGTWVNQQCHISSKSKNWMSFTQEMAAREIPIKNFELHISWVNPTKKTATFFDIKMDSKILRLARLRGTPDGPFVYFESFFDPKIGMTGDENFKLPLYEMLKQSFNVIAYKSQEEISAMAADDHIAEKLDIGIGSPILFRRRYVVDKQGKPIEYNKGYYRSDRFIYAIESEQGP